MNDNEFNQDVITSQCSDCRNPLMQYVIKEYTNKVKQIRAKCCYCNGYSFKENIEGTFQSAPYYEVLNEFESKIITKISDIKTEPNGIETFILEKAQ